MHLLHMLCGRLEISVLVGTNLLIFVSSISTRKWVGKALQFDGRGFCSSQKETQVVKL